MDKFQFCPNPLAGCDSNNGKSCYPRSIVSISAGFTSRLNSVTLDLAAKLSQEKPWRKLTDQTGSSKRMKRIYATSTAGGVCEMAIAELARDLTFEPASCEVISCFNNDNTTTKT